jgi:hypothetical protein
MHLVYDLSPSSEWYIVTKTGQYHRAGGVALSIDYDIFWGYYYISLVLV